MPELPEVESIRLGLEKVLLNEKFLGIDIMNGKIVSSHSNIRTVNQSKMEEFENGVQNKKIISLKRRAKNLIIEFEDRSIILIHLKMTGQLVFEKNKALPGEKEKEKMKGKVTGKIVRAALENDTLKLPNKHTQIAFTVTNGMLYYNDVRKFGYVLYYKDLENANRTGHFENIGLDPFEKAFTEKYLKEELKKKSRKIKEILLDQSIVTGAGNIYSDEICFASKILPDRNCNSLKEEEIKALYKNIKDILKKAISRGGSSVSNYLLADGSRGNYAKEHKVYGRGGLPCKRCKRELERMSISTRTTIYCKNCQK